ncbi:MAG: fasciclin domain-containing protein [Nakamurella sp.]
MIMKRALLLVAAAGIAVTLAACGSSSDTASSTSSATASAAAEASSMASPMSSAPMSSGDMSSDPMSSGSMASGEMSPASLVGPGCAAYAAAVPSGAGSVDGMAQDAVATAASNNPLLTTLTAAVSGKVNPQVDLVNTLNSGEFTVFAPVDDAFAKIDAGTMTTLTTDSALLSKILTYHVVAGQLSPSEIVGTHATVEGGSLTVAGSGDDLTVDGTSKVICGGVQTKNATVYLIDTVLTPPAS